MFNLAKIKKAIYAGLASGCAMFAQSYSVGRDINANEWRNIAGTIFFIGFGTWLLRNGKPENPTHKKEEEEKEKQEPVRFLDDYS